MDRNRKIILIILILMLLSCILAIIDIGLNMDKLEQKAISLSVPQFGPGVGVLRLYGPIMISSGGGMLSMAEGTDAVVAKLDEMASDSNIRAIVVRINSPGGTVAATQEIFNKLIEIRKQNKIIVASMGDIAASGGYYVASASNFIFANHGTLTGSIGVIAAAPNLRGLFEKLGIKMNVIKSGQYKDILSSHRDMSNEEKDLLQNLIDSSYDQFVKDVSLGRNMAISDIKPFADGRVFDGDTALKCKLVDGIGTYDDAVKKAKALAKLPEDAPVYEENLNPLSMFLSSLEGKLKGENVIEKQFRQKNYSKIEYSVEP